MILINYKPLCFIGEKAILAYSNNRVYLIDIVSLNVDLLVELNRRDVFSFLSRWRLFERIFRLAPRACVKIDDNSALIFWRGRHYVVEIEKKSLTIISKTRAPLMYASIEHCGAVAATIYFGEYLPNAKKDEVSILSICPESMKTNLVYKFGVNLINHVHFLVEDVFRCRTWIFTGDFGDAAAIWYTDDGFKTVKRFAYGAQRYRACFAYITEDAIYYATDTPLEQNYFRRIIFDGDSWAEEDLFAINGPCIYGTSVGDYLVFSTSVEPGNSQSAERGILSALSYKLGEGINSWYSEVIVYNLISGEHEVLDRYKKDFLPMRLCQFGSVIFPSGKSDEYLVYYGNAVKNIEGSLVIKRAAEIYV